MVEQSIVDWLENRPATPLILGVSGGRDSMCLLDVMHRHGQLDLRVVHVNHGLRGAESLADEQLVRSYCKEHSISCEVLQADVEERMRLTGEGLETVARALRLEVFSEVARKSMSEHLLLAHHANDQAETVLHNLLRGASGVRGMSVRKTMEEYSLVLHRPLLRVSREEITRYVESYQVPYRDDASNEEGFTVRNRIRAELLPLMQDIMGRDVVEPLCRAASLDAERCEGMRSHLSDLGLEDPQGRLFLPKLQLLPEGLQKEAIHQYLEKQGVGELSYALLNRCRELLTNRAVAKVNLPGGLYLRRSQQRLFV